MGHRGCAESFDSAETTTDAPALKQGVTASQRKTIADDANAKLLMMMAMLGSESDIGTEGVKGTVKSAKNEMKEMKEDAKHLEAKMGADSET